MSLSLDPENALNEAHDLQDVQEYRLVEAIFKNAVDEIGGQPMLHPTRPKQSIKRIEDWLQTWDWFTEAEVKGTQSGLFTVDFCCEVLDKDARNVRLWIWSTYETQMRWCETQLAKLINMKAQESIRKQARWKASRQARLQTITHRIVIKKSTTKKATKR